MRDSMATITGAIDGDTTRQEDEQGRTLPARRSGHTQTQESVHPTESKNTDEGREASKLMKAMHESGNVKPTYDYGMDHYGRRVGGQAKTINGVGIDLDFIQMDQGYSTYQTRFGKAKDPALHENYKEYWSDIMPYQAGDLRQPMDPADYKEIADAQTAFAKSYNDLKNGDGTQEEFDQATFNLYKDQNKVAHFRHANAGWGREVNVQDAQKSDTDSILFAIKDDPALQEKYNRAMRQEGLSIAKYPEKEKGFWEKLGATYGQMSSIANHINARRTGAARLNKVDYDIPVEDFTEGLPQNFHKAILEEVDVYGEAAGLEARKQLLEDIANNKITSDMPWYSQIGYGIAVALTDPLSYVAGAGVAKGVAEADKVAAPLS